MFTRECLFSLLSYLWMAEVFRWNDTKSVVLATPKKDKKDFQEGQFCNEENTVFPKKCRSRLILGHNKFDKENKHWIIIQPVSIKIIPKHFALQRKH